MSYLQDNFDDNVRASEYWDELLTDPQTSVNETNGRLEVTCTRGIWLAENAGYVSVEKYDLSTHYIEIEVTQLSNLWTMNLAISPTLNATPHPNFGWGLWDYYRLRKNRNTTQVDVYRKLLGDPGPGPTLRHSQLWAAATGTLRIELRADGNIYFYENGVQICGEAYTLSSPEVYIYFFGSDNTGFTGTDFFDNFTSNIPLFIDNQPTENAATVESKPVVTGDGSRHTKPDLPPDPPYILKITQTFKRARFVRHLSVRIARA